MAQQKSHVCFLVIIIITSHFTSSCNGRNMHFSNKKEGYGHSSNNPYINDGISLHLQKYSADGIQYIPRDFLDVEKTFNVDDFGAKGDGISDDTEAFKKAWEEACLSGVELLVPSKKTYLLKPIIFSGPCKSSITMQISGTILASENRSDYDEDDDRQWLEFRRVNNLSVQGGGIIDGNGKIWWENSCKVNKKNPCKHAPTALQFSGCNNLVVRNLNIQNAQQMHVVFENCRYVKASHLKVNSPGNSPNTDGIHITHSQDIDVMSCIIETGDDCISIVSGSSKIRARDITCGPGHGISIGSLGENNSEAHVSNVIVNGATLSGTTNGVRIKTWQGGSGEASNITFQNIRLNNVDNPIIIDQNYCDQDEPCKQQTSAVKVGNVVYQNITGTSSSEKAVVFDCSESYPCKEITMQNIHIEYSESAKTTEATCCNAQVIKIEDVSPQCSTT